MKIYVTSIFVGDQDKAENSIPSFCLNPATKPFKEALVADGIAAHSFQVQDLAAEHKKLSDLGVQFVTEPMNAGSVHMAVFDDTCGNLIQLIQMKEG